MRSREAPHWAVDPPACKVCGTEFMVGRVLVRCSRSTVGLADGERTVTEWSCFCSTCDVPSTRLEFNSLPLEGLVMVDKRGSMLIWTAYETLPPEVSEFVLDALLDIKHSITVERRSLAHRRLSSAWKLERRGDQVFAPRPRQTKIDAPALLVATKTSSRWVRRQCYSCRSQITTPTCYVAKLPPKGSPERAAWDSEVETRPQICHRCHDEAGPAGPAPAAPEPAAVLRLVKR